MAKKKRMVVITTDKDRRGVFFGELVVHDATMRTCTLKHARMAIYWSRATKGVVGLASIGPQPGSRISPPVPSIKLNGVTAVMDASKEAASEWEAGRWD